MPFKASKRHQYWSIDIRYIERHQLDDPKPVFVISILENYSRAVLASALSPTQDLCWPFTPSDMIFWQSGQRSARI